MTEFAQNDNVIEIEHLAKSFDGKEILKDVSLYLRKGENLAVLGKSGIGKSVLIKCIVGLIEADSGMINVLGNNIIDIKPKELLKIRQKVGFLFQGGALYDSMSVKENLLFPINRNLHLFNKQNIKEHIEEALESVGLLEAIDKMPSELSGGMKKRIGLARTLILNPDIILYDEPTTGLDPITSREISNLILKVQKSYNTASIIVTHDISCVKLTSNRINIIRDGNIYFEGKYEELINAEDEWSNSFLK
ncbi:MAG: ATP-binding cassette domain-containing protein [Bacteroidales bacterium]|jgi:phospholipid/cholesterol/gamma-HCH transport system ATP-binding protein|nr:ATP-binding cassette domain-containing protein [Bacteroidales bacterium]